MQVRKSECEAIQNVSGLLSDIIGDVHIVKSPLRVRRNKGIRTRQGYFILNFNAFRMIQDFTKNFVKKEYKAVVGPQIATLPVFRKVLMIYTVHQGTRRRYDKSNVCSLHDKFFMDSLVEGGKLTDDDSTHDVCSVYLPGEVLKHDPHVEICICSLNG
jgi:hypothetical protein